MKLRVKFRAENLNIFKDVSCIMITYPISSNFCEKILCNAFDFTIFYLPVAANWGFL